MQCRRWRSESVGPPVAARASPELVLPMTSPMWSPIAAHCSRLTINDVIFDVRTAKSRQGWQMEIRPPGSAVGKVEQPPVLVD